MTDWSHCVSSSFWHCVFIIDLCYPFYWVRTSARGLYAKQKSSKLQCKSVFSCVFLSVTPTAETHKPEEDTFGVSNGNIKHVECLVDICSYITCICRSRSTNKSYPECFIDNNKFLNNMHNVFYCKCWTKVGWKKHLKEGEGCWKLHSKKFKTNPPQSYRTKENIEEYVRIKHLLTGTEPIRR